MMIEARLIADGVVAVELHGYISGLVVDGARLTLEEAQQIRDELARVIEQALRGGGST